MKRTEERSIDQSSGCWCDSSRSRSATGRARPSSATSPRATTQQLTPPHLSLKAERPRGRRVHIERVCLCARAGVCAFLLRNGRVLPICASPQPPHPWPMERETTALPCTLPPSVSLTTASHSSLLSSCPPTENTLKLKKLSRPLLYPLSLSVLVGWNVTPTEGALKWCNIHPHHHLHRQHRGRLPLGLKKKKKNTARKQDCSAGCPTNTFLLTLKFQIIPLNASLSATHTLSHTHTHTPSSYPLPSLSLLFRLA